jgi:CubicO group peptidase (beta-lactamase class C family)
VPESVSIVLRDDLAPVGELFASIVRRHPGHRLSFAAYHRGERVVLLDSHGAGDTLVTLYSTSKGAMAVTVGLLVQDGSLALNDPVARYWPEFSAAGKQAITIAELMSHQAGLINVDGGFGLDEFTAHEPLAERLAAQKPWWTPTGGHGYHGLTYGTLVDELVRRVTGSTVDVVFRTRVARPRDVNMAMLVDPETESRVLPPQTPDVLPLAGMEIPEDSLLGVALNVSRGFPGPMEVSHIPEVRAQGPVGLAGVASADGLARLYASMMDTVDGREPLLEPQVAAGLTAARAVGPDLCLPADTGFACGFEVSPYPDLISGGDWFGHGGLGGSGGSYVPRARTAFGFTTDHVPPGGGRSEAEADLRSAVLDCLCP